MTDLTRAHNLDPSRTRFCKGRFYHPCNSYRVLTFGLLVCRFDKLRDLFEDAKVKGYKIALGGDFPTPTVDQDDPADGSASGNGRGGLFVPVTIVDNPPEDSRIVQEEQFGPIVPLLKWKDEADVIQRASKSLKSVSLDIRCLGTMPMLADATMYGLGASVWGDDVTQAVRVASQIEAGST